MEDLMPWLPIIVLGITATISHFVAIGKLKDRIHQVEKELVEIRAKAQSNDNIELILKLIRKFPKNK